MYNSQVRGSPTMWPLSSLFSISVCVLLIILSLQSNFVECQAYQRQGTTQVFNITSNDTTIGLRYIQVYLPPNYNASDVTTRYPVVFFLHGFIGNHLSFDYLNTVVDKLIVNGTLAEGAIVVKPDGSLPGSIPPIGSLWANSELNGNFEDFLMNEVVPWTDATFNTDTRPSRRMVMGHSFGASGAVRLGAQYPQIFGSIACHSGFVKMDEWLVQYYVNTAVFSEFNATAVVPSGPSKIFTLFLFTGAKAWSPNLDAEYSVDLPFWNNGSGIVRLDVVDRWEAFSPHVVIAQNLASFRAREGSLWIDIGSRDELLLLQPNLDFAGLLLNWGVTYNLKVYDGPHNNLTLLELRFQDSVSGWANYMSSLPTDEMSSSPMPETSSPVTTLSSSGGSLNYGLVFGVIGGVLGFFIIAGVIIFIVVKSKWHVIFLEKELAPEDGEAADI